MLDFNGYITCRNAEVAVYKDDKIVTGLDFIGVDVKGWVTTDEALEIMNKVSKL